MTENMLLLPDISLRGDSRIDDRVTVKVKGSSGNVYTIHVYSNDATCSCPDYTRRQQPCKHILFLFGRVCRSADVGRYLAGLPVSHLRSQPVLHDMLDDRVRHLREDGFLLHGPTGFALNYTNIPTNERPPGCTGGRAAINPPDLPVVHRDLEEGEECPICFEGMQKESALCQCRFSCGRWYHSQCMSKWRQRSSQCPLCRARLA